MIYLYIFWIILHKRLLFPLAFYNIKANHRERGLPAVKEEYQKIAAYLDDLHRRYNIQICIKDFCGFIPINKDLDEVLQPFLAHTNPFCMYMKSDQAHYRTCLSMIRRMHRKCEETSGVYFGICHAGLGEYIIPIRSGKVLLGALNIGFFETNERRSIRRICRTCSQPPALDAAHAVQLYRQFIRPAQAEIEPLLPGLELLAEYLGQTYRLMQRTHSASELTGRYHNSSEDTVLTHAMEYIRLNSAGPITVAQLAEFCHCSQSYISRIFKRRTGVNINVYINKTRIEAAKNHLLLSNETVAEIALAVGFNDPNYFSRIFTQIIGIAPTEFRRRFHQELPPQQKT